MNRKSSLKCSKKILPFYEKKITSKNQHLLFFQEKRALYFKYLYYEMIDEVGFLPFFTEELSVIVSPSN